MNFIFCKLQKPQKTWNSFFEASMWQYDAKRYQKVLFTFVLSHCAMLVFIKKSKLWRKHHSRSQRQLCWLLLSGYRWGISLRRCLNSKVWQHLSLCSQWRRSLRRLTSSLPVWPTLSLTGQKFLPTVEIYVVPYW